MRATLLVLVVLSMTGCSLPTCTRYSTVLSVGGCSSGGLCGVMTEDGFSREYYPVAGSKVCTQYGESK